MKYFPQGLGGTVAPVVTQAPLFLLGQDAVVVYVDSVSGVDDAAPAGLTRSRPLQTLAQAVTNTTGLPGSIIVLLDTHDEIVNTASSPEITLSTAGITIVGEGSDSDGIPSAKVSPTNGATVNLSITGAGLLCQNVRFGEPAASRLTYVVEVDADGVVFDSCVFDAGQYTDGTVIGIHPDTAISTTFEECTFRSVSTSLGALATAPYVMMASGSEAGDPTLELNGCVFDGGQTGFRDASDYPNATDFSAAPDSFTLRAVSLSLLRGANLVVSGSGLGNVVNAQTVTGGSYVEGI